jgi:hypothetical protein
VSAHQPGPGFGDQAQPKRRKKKGGGRKISKA